MIDTFLSFFLSCVNSSIALSEISLNALNSAGINSFCLIIISSFPKIGTSYVVASVLPK
jgi:hypothetical protein